MQHAQPQRNRGKSQPEQDPEKSLSHQLERKMNSGCKVERNIHRVSESLLVPWIPGDGRIERPAVVALLNLASYFGTVGIASVQQKLSRAYPVWIQIGKIAARPAMRRGIGDLMRNHHTVDVSPHPASTEDREQRQQPRTKPEQRRSRDCGHLVPSSTGALRSAGTPAPASLRAKATLTASNGSVITAGTHGE